MVLPLSFRPLRLVIGIAPLWALVMVWGCGRVEPLETPWLQTTVQQPQQPQRGQWAGHLGATLHGVAKDAALPVHFSPSTHVRWKVDLPGSGSSSPTIFDNRVFLTAERPGKPPELVVLCIDRVRGVIQWQQSIGVARGPTHRKNGYATATVATDGERIYATFGERGVFCFSVDGDRLWHTPLAHLEHPWGHASSPVLSGELVIQLADGASGSYLVAMNCYTGDVVWSTERNSSGSWTTPVLVPVEVNDPVAGAGRRWELIVNGTGSANGAAGSVIAYDPQTGDELWRVEGTTDIPCPTAIVGGSLVISTSGANGPIMAIRPGGQGDATHTHVVWRKPWGGPYVPTGVIQNGLLYLVSDGGILRCLDLQTGEACWEKRLGRSYSASLVAGDGKLYATSEQGDIHVLATGDRCQLLAVNHLRQPCLATPAIAHSELFVRTEEQLYCFANLPAPASDNTNIVHDPPLELTPEITPVNALEETAQ